MRRHAACLAILGTLALLASLSAGCGSSDRREGAIGPAAGTAGVVQKGDPFLAAAPGYVGSEACSTCHPDQFVGWSRSLHNAPLKTVAELGDAIFVNDANGNGVNDFRDGLNFNDNSTDAFTNAALKALRPNAPILGYSNGKYLITIGTVTFEVQRTQGGNGYWKQRYHSKVGNAYYITPVQYNERSKQYVNYNEGHWYSAPSVPPGSNNTPRYTSPYGSDNLVAQFGANNDNQLGTGFQLGTARSWENRCAGCHQTGLTLDNVTRLINGVNVVEAVTGYSELNIGCEACHGPGATHAATRNPADIINPANFKALGVTGIRAANQVCGACHSRGEGEFTLLGMTLPTEYPSRPPGGPVEFPLPGDSVVDNSTGNPFVVMAPGVYGANAPLGQKFVANHATYASWYDNWYNGFNFTYAFPTYWASNQHHQQWLDMEQGPHASDLDVDITCFDCHDPHKAAGNPNANPDDDHQIKDRIVAGGITIAVKSRDNSLCLACHNSSRPGEEEPFDTITPAMVATIASGAPDPALQAAVSLHTQHSYNPAAVVDNTAASRCMECHMPTTASSAGSGIRDIRNHTFLVIRPGLSMTVAGTDGPTPITPAGVRNSCTQCHPQGDTRIDPTGALVGDAYLDFLDNAFTGLFGF